MKTSFENLEPVTHVTEFLDIEAIADEIDHARIKPESFRGQKFFDDNEIEQDLETCRKLEEAHRTEQKTFSRKEQDMYEAGLAAEYTLRHAIEDFGWLTKEVTMIVTSQYDDFIRGIDSVAQIVMGEGRFEHLGFAIDFATGTERIEHKLAKTFDSLDNGFTSSVKYFDSPKTGKLKNFKIPRLVIGAGPDNLDRLENLCGDILDNSEIPPELSKKVHSDIFRFVLFGEIQAQLSVFINRLRHVNEKANKEGRSDISKRAGESLTIHENALSTIERLTQEAKIDMKSIHDHIRGDEFAIKLGQMLSLLSQTPIEFGK